MFSEELTKILEAHSITGFQLAHEMYLEASTVRRIIKGKLKPDSYIPALCKTPSLAEKVTEATLWAWVIVDRHTADSVLLAAQIINSQS
jgi:transcriptional regulator with XRE-family HTH domain